MDPDIKQTWAEVRAFFAASGLTQEEISKAAGVSQAAVSRFLESCPKRHGRAFKKICIYAEARMVEVQMTLPLPIEDESLVAALREVWNGSPEHARALAAMIRAAGLAARISMG